MSWRKKLTESEIAELMQRLAELTGKPGPLADGLISAAQNTSSLPVRKAMQGLAQQLSKGGDVAQGLENRSLPLYLIGLVHAGTQTGRLPVILSALSRYYRRRRQWKRRIWLSLAYPIFVFAFLGVIATTSAISNPVA